MRMRFLVSALAIGLAAGGGEVKACESLATPSATDVTETRYLVANDLARLRDIGPSSLEDGHTGVFSVSPDGRTLAFPIRQADPVANAYCLGMFVLSLDPGARPLQIDAGGEVIMASFSAWGFAVSLPAGVAATITPQWSPDGQWVAYLRRDQGSTQVWRARADGTRSERVSNLPFDVEAFAWDEKGHAVIVSGRPGLVIAQKAIDVESIRGFHYDERIMPLASAVPRVREPIDRAAYVVAIGSPTPRRATLEEEKRLTPVRQPGQPAGVSFYTTDASGNAAFTAPSVPDDVTAPSYLHLKRAKGDEAVCARQECTGIMDLWALERPGSFVYLRHERGASSQSLYTVTDGNLIPRKIFETEDLLASCRMHINILYCAQEGSLQPRRIVRIDLDTGEVTPVFDPNPEFKHLRLSAVKRLRWTNAYGIATFGDLVLPPDHQAGQRHPLVVVGYNSRGFLRGGTGDDYPIQWLATNGYAVLSYQTPPDIGYFRGAKTWADMNRLARIDWVDFRSTASAIEKGVDAAIATGAIDPEALGLTGLSYGSTTAQFTLVNSKRFKAAVVSNCCEEGSLTNTLVGPAMIDILHASGYPSLQEDGTAYWKPMSFRLNAATMSTPLLMQLPDDEYLGALESYTALRVMRQPVDLYVFHNETHIKWQPQHRLASYQRTLEWFDFWLKGIELSDPLKTRQYDTWRALRSQANLSLGASPGP